MFKKSAWLLHLIEVIEVRLHAHKFDIIILTSQMAGSFVGQRDYLCGRNKLTLTSQSHYGNENFNGLRREARGFP